MNQQPYVKVSDVMKPEVKMISSMATVREADRKSVV